MQVQGPRFQPAVTGLVNGNYVVTWTDDSAFGTGIVGPDGSGAAIVYRIYNDTGTAQTAEIVANTHTAGDQQAPSIAALADGSFVIAWVDGSGKLFDGTPARIKSQHFDASGNKLGSEVTVNASGSDDQSLPKMNALSTGGYIVSWRETVASSKDNVMAQLYDSSGNPAGSEITLEAFTSDELGPSYGLTGLSDGSFLMSWDDYKSRVGTTTSPNLLAQGFSSAGVAQGVKTYLNDPANTAAVPAVAGMANGRFAAAWVTTSGGPNSIRTRLFTNGLGPLGAEVLANTDTSRGKSSPAVTGLLYGGYVVTWLDSSMTSGQVFAGDGSKLGGEFNVSAANVAPAGALVAPGSHGGFAVVWTELARTSLSSVKIRTYTPAP